MSETLIPTGGLRFARRYMKILKTMELVTVLQQRYVTPGGKEVWRDVPTVDEAPAPQEEQGGVRVQRTASPEATTTRGTR